MTEREPKPSPFDMSDDFIRLEESEFFDRVQSIGDRPIELNIPIGLLGSDVFINRLSTLMKMPAQLQRPRIKIIATQGEYETYSERFKKMFGQLDWEIIN